MKNQKGQDIVEFALLFPVFMMILTGIIYIGFLFGDYVSLQNQVRSAARDAAVMGHYTTTTNQSGQTVTVDNYASLANEYGDTIQKNGIVTQLYVFKKIEFKDPKEHDDGPEGSVRVNLTMTFNKDVGFAKLLNLLGIPKVLGEEFPITYYMHDETYQKNS